MVLNMKAKRIMEFPDVPNYKLAILLEKITLPRLNAIFANQGAHEVLSVLTVKKLLEIPPEDLCVILSRQKSRYNGKANSLFKKWKAALEQWGIKNVPKSRVKSDNEIYATGKGRLKGKQRITELQECMAFLAAQLELTLETLHDSMVAP